MGVILLFSFSSIVSANIVNIADSSNGTQAAVTVETQEKNKGISLVTQISQEEAIAIATSAIEIPKGFIFFEAKLETESMNSFDGPQWTIDYLMLPGYYITISVDSQRGVIAYYATNYFVNLEKSMDPSRIDEEAMKQIAWKWLKKIKNPHLESIALHAHKRIYPSPLEPDFTYNLEYDRMINGVRFPQNGISIVMNSRGQIMTYHQIWSDQVKFEPLTSIMSKDEAIKKLKEQMKLVLTFQKPMYERTTMVPYIQYSFDSFAIEAKTGHRLDQYHHVDRQTSNLFATEKTLTDKPLSNLTYNKELITQSQVINKVKSKVIIPDNYVLEYANYEGADKENSSAIWELKWINPQNKKNSSGEEIDDSILVLFDARTEIIRGFSHLYQEESNSKKEVTLKFEQAQQTAIEFVKQQLPHLTHELVVEPIESTRFELMKGPSSPIWMIYFKRQIQGVTVQEDYIYVYIDKATGKVDRFSVNLSDSQLPVILPKLIKAEQAKQLLLDNVNVTLKYVVSYLQLHQETRSEGNLSNRKVIAKLVYQWEPNHIRETLFLDATNGKWRKISTGSEYNVPEEVIDLQGHWAQKQM